MGLILGNPAGLWALTAIPVILLIHFLQRETRRESVSTLFLIERLARESQKGRHFERIRNSTSLWLQILAALLLTWLLVEPRWMRPDSVQRVAVVLDDSVSMRAFFDPGAASPPDLSPALRRLERTAAETEWMLLDSSGRRGTLYGGANRSELLARVDQWRPQAGTHDVTPVLRQALAAAHPGGAVLFVTDRRHDAVPEGVEVLGLGEPVENAGFTGLRLEERDGQTVWRALVRNYGTRAQSREWWVEFDGGRTESRGIDLEPGGTVSLSGAFPAEADRATLVLGGDRFPLDDRLPFVRPRPKTLLLAPEPESPLRPHLAAFLDSLSHWREAEASQEPDFRFATFSNDREPAGSGVFFWSEETDPSERTRAPIVAERHRLTENLSWQGFSTAPAEGLTTASEDLPLLWQGDRPLLILRETQGEKQLLVGFDIRESNAARIPAFIVVLHRFLEDLRDTKVAYARRNVDAGQNLDPAVEPFGDDVTLHSEDGPEATVPPARAGRLRAPDEPGFFSVRQGETPLLDAAAQFADAREADFRDAESFRVEARGERQREYAERNTRRDFLAPLWMLLLGGVLLMSWRHSDRET